MKRNSLFLKNVRRPATFYSIMLKYIALLVNPFSYFINFQSYFIEHWRQHLIIYFLVFLFYSYVFATRVSSEINKVYLILNACVN